MSPLFVTCPTLLPLPLLFGALLVLGLSLLHFGLAALRPFLALCVLLLATLLYFSAALVLAIVASPAGLLGLTLILAIPSPTLFLILLVTAATLCVRCDADAEQRSPADKQNCKLLTQIRFH